MLTDVRKRHRFPYFYAQNVLIEKKINYLIINELCFLENSYVDNLLMYLFQFYYTFLFY